MVILLQYSYDCRWLAFNLRVKKTHPEYWKLYKSGQSLKVVFFRYCDIEANFSDRIVTPIIVR
jgi:hypothetical protein